MGKKRGLPKKALKKLVEEETENWFKEIGSPGSSNLERWSMKKCERNGVNPDNLVEGTK